jgi:hypothetical protein
MSARSGKSASRGRKPSSAAKGASSAKDTSSPKGTSPIARRAAKHRREQLKLIREQVKDGSLVIRQMTAAERKKYPPRPAGKRSSRG